MAIPALTRLATRGTARPRDRGHVALTVDDGPHPLGTPAALEILAEFGVTATFFLIAEQAERYPAIVRHIVADGHGVALHGYRHRLVRDYVARRRPQIAAEAGRSVPVGFVLQDHLPGAEAEVDFRDVWVQLAGVSTRCFLFTFRLSHSGKAVHRVFASQGQEAFIEGHQAAFRVVGGVPTDNIRYDDLRSTSRLTDVRVPRPAVLSRARARRRRRG